MHVVWTGERVRLRPFDSAQELYELSAELHVECTPYWGPMWFSRPQEELKFESTGLIDATGICIFAVDRLDSGQTIGTECTIMPKPGGLGAEVGTFILREHQRHGFGVEAKQLALCFLFENFPLEYVKACTLRSHRPAHRSLELCGMQLITGCKDAVHYRGGKYEAQVYYRMTREQWEGLPTRKTVKRGGPCT